MALQAVPRPERKGLIIVYTGNGKGKTTAALGMVVRAIGYNWRVLMIQFIKGDWIYGELEGYKKLAPNFELKRMGKGFVRIMGDKRPIEDHIEAAKTALRYASDQMGKDYDILILDEVNVAIREGLLTVQDVLDVLKLIEMADLVTEMTEIKHPYQKGILAQPGVDY
jgi:cob(I)alamin adenosyltransferase